MELEVIKNINLINSIYKTNLYFRLSSTTNLKAFGGNLLTIYVGIRNKQRTLITSSQSYKNRDGNNEDTDLEDKFHNSDDKRLSMWHFIYMGY